MLVGGDDIDASAALDIRSSVKGVLAPRLTKAARDAIVSPAEGLLLYQVDDVVGFYYYDGVSWLPVRPAWSSCEWS